MRISQYARMQRGSKSVATFSKELGISDTQLKRIEKGFWDSASHVQLKNFCKAFKLNYEDLEKLDIEICSEEMDRAMYEFALYEKNRDESIQNFYKTFQLNNYFLRESYYLEKPNRKLTINGFTIDSHREGWDYYLTSKKENKIIPIYFIDYKKISPTEPLNDENFIINKYYKDLITGLFYYYTNDLVNNAIVVTNSKTSFDYVTRWLKNFASIPQYKQLLIAYSSSGNVSWKNESAIITEGFNI